MRTVCKSKSKHPRDIELEVAARFLGDLGQGRKRNIDSTLRRHRQYARTLRPVLEGYQAFDWVYRLVRSQDPNFRLVPKSGEARKSKL